MKWPWHFQACRHEHIRCVHGDEINHANGLRAACLDCGKYLLMLPPLPYTCTVTGLPHPDEDET